METGLSQSVHDVVVQAIAGSATACRYSSYVSIINNFGFTCPARVAIVKSLLDRTNTGLAPKLINDVTTSTAEMSLAPGGTTVFKITGEPEGALEAFSMLVYSNDFIPACLANMTFNAWYTQECGEVTNEIATSPPPIYLRNGQCLFFAVDGVLQSGLAYILNGGDAGKLRITDHAADGTPQSETTLDITDQQGNMVLNQTGEVGKVQICAEELQERATVATTVLQYQTLPENLGIQVMVPQAGVGSTSCTANRNTACFESKVLGPVKVRVLVKGQPLQIEPLKLFPDDPRFVKDSFMVKGSNSGDFSVWEHFKRNQEGKYEGAIILDVGGGFISESTLMIELTDEFGNLTIRTVDDVLYDESCDCFTVDFEYPW